MDKRKSRPRNGKGSNRGKRGNVSYPGDWDSKRDQEAADMQGRCSAKSNDPSWYTASPQLLRDAASIPFSWAVGTPINWNNILLETLTQPEYVVPGVMTLKVEPTIGWSTDQASPVNVGATAFYTWVRHMNSGSANYDSPDLMVYALAMASIYSYIVWLQRNYGMAYLYSQKNRYMPETLLLANGVNAEDVRQHLADFRYGINVLIAKAASLAVPATMPIFSRMAFLFKNIYTEGTSVKDQLYMYVPGSFWVYNPQQDGASALYNARPFDGTNLMTVEDMLTFGNTMLQQIFQNEDMNIMSGDIKKAYGEGNLIKLVQLDEYYPVDPVFDIGVLEQMKNATVVSKFDPEVDGTDSIIQDPQHGYLIAKPKCQTAGNLSDWYSNALSGLLNTLSENKLLTTTTAEVTPELVIESTRLMLGAFGYVKATATTPGTINLYCGSEVVSGATYWTFKVNTDESIVATQFTSYYNEYLNVTETQDELVAGMRKLAVISNFRFHPAIHALGIRPGSSGNTYNISDGYLNFDVDNYAVLTSQDLRRMHEAALMGELAVPSIARLS